MDRTMTAVVTHGPKDYRVEEVPVPEPGPGEVRIRHHAVVIAFLHFGGEQLAARRVDAFTDHAKGFVKADDDGFCFRFNDGTGHS